MINLKIKYWLSLALIILLVGCGDKESNQINSAEAKKELRSEEKKKSEETIKKQQTIEIKVIAKGESMNELAFEPQRLSVPANAKVKLTFINQSKADGMYHNFVLVKEGTGQEVATAGISAGKENNFVPLNNDKLIENTAIADMGKTLTLEFTAPKKGIYNYICTYPGHFPAMIGRLEVK